MENINLFDRVANGEMTQQQGLNQVVMNRVQAMIANKATGVQNTMSRLISEGKIAQDYIAPLGVNLKNKGDRPVMTFAADGRAVELSMPDGTFSLHQNAVGQLAERMGIPARYLKTLATGEPWQMTLAAEILNQHSDWTERSRVLGCDGVNDYSRWYPHSPYKRRGFFAFRPSTRPGSVDHYLVVTPKGVDMLRWELYGNSPL